MYNHLVADYILGYALSTDLPFSPEEIGKELYVPAEPVKKIMLDLSRHKSQWFDVISGSSESDFKIARKNEYDDEIISWLLNGTSKDFYKQTELPTIRKRSPYKWKELPAALLNAAGIKRLLKLLTIILLRQFNEDKKLVIKYVLALKATIRQFGKYRSL